jgi:hypothetical protein
MQMEGAKGNARFSQFFITDAPETSLNETAVLVSHRDGLFICKSSSYKHHKTYYSFLPKFPYFRKKVKLKTITVFVCLCLFHPKSFKTN